MSLLAALGPTTKPKCDYSSFANMSTAFRASSFIRTLIALLPDQENGAARSPTFRNVAVG